MVACYIQCPKDLRNQKDLEEILGENGVYFWPVKEKQQNVHYYALHMSNREHRAFFNSNRLKLIEGKIKKGFHDKKKINESSATTATIYYKKNDEEPFEEGYVGEEVQSQWTGVKLNSRKNERNFQTLQEDELNAILKIAAREEKPRPETGNPE